MPSITRTRRVHERSQKRGAMQSHHNGPSFLRIVDEGVFNCKHGAPFVTVYISTASTGQHKFDAAQRWVETRVVPTRQVVRVQP
jgi:hypothetical protein